MSNVLRIVNSVDEIYEGAEIKETKKGFQCPICKKLYKRKGSAENHLKERDCYDIKEVLKGTEREKKARDLFSSIMAEFYPNARSTLSIFRKSKFYAPISKYSIFCSIHEIYPELYFAWLQEKFGFTMINAVLKAGRDEENLRQCRKFLMQNPQYIKNVSFLKEDNDLHKTNPKDFTRALEKANLSILYYMDVSGLSVYEIMNDMPLDYADRVLNVYHISTGKGE